MRLLWDDRAWEEYCAWQQEDKKTLKRINNLLKEIARTPYQGTGKPEPLKNNLSKWWSRRIDSCNRIVYRQFDESTILIASCKNHYN